MSIIDAEGNEFRSINPARSWLKAAFFRQGTGNVERKLRNNFKSSFEDSKTRIYRTGDIGQLSADGCLTHLGRKDDRVKIRNFRVDIGEVEAKLAEHPEVRLASVTAKEDSFGDIRLIAYFVPRNKPGPTVTGLREFLGAKLPAYMVPSAFVVLAELPLTGTGKVNRRALPDPGKSRPNLATPLVEPTTAIEGELAAIWQGVLSLDQVGIHDNFFRPGRSFVSRLSCDCPVGSDLPIGVTDQSALRRADRGGDGGDYRANQAQRQVTRRSSAC